MGKVDVPANQKLILGGTRWFSQEELEMHLLEHVKEEHYVQFVTAMDHLAKQPFAFLCGDFIMKFRKDVSAQKLATAAQNLPMLQHDQNGRLFAEAQGTRKDARAWVKLWGKGTGNIIMDGKEMDDLVFHQSRETLLFPFIFIGKLGQFDVDAVTEGGGESGKTGAVRLAVSRALCAFITPEEREKLRLGGLLTRDIRTRERLKQAPHKGARAKWRWKKR